jgi:hypothetical protein
VGLGSFGTQRGVLHLCVRLGICKLQQSHFCHATEVHNCHTHFSCVVLGPALQRGETRASAALLYPMRSGTTTQSDAVHAHGIPSLPHLPCCTYKATTFNRLMLPSRGASAAAAPPLLEAVPPRFPREEPNVRALFPLLEAGPPPRASPYRTLCEPSAIENSRAAPLLILSSAASVVADCCCRTLPRGASCGAWMRILQTWDG